MATEQKGVIYYKLDPDYHYKGDYTKNCGLNGSEIDSNFHFLRGYDIASFDVSDNKEELIITRLNGEKLSLNVRESFNDYEFDYDPSKGVLIITTPFGENINLEGFLSEMSLKIHSDATIDGNGTRFKPVSVSANARTGTFKPVKTFIDEEKGEKLPTENRTKGDRYLTRESINAFGRLYPLEGVLKIQERLEEIGSEWRVPTKEDWDQLLNISENRIADKNHDDEKALTNVYYGAHAGAFLKSNDYWEPIYRKLEDGEIVLNNELRYDINEEGEYVQDVNGKYLKVINSEDKFGFAVYPVGFGGRRGKSSIGGYKEWAAYWTSTEEDGHRDMFVKVFSHKERGVEQNSWGKDCYLSLRLVKDYRGDNLNDVESIDGNTVGCVYIPTVDDVDVAKYDKSLVWTKENVSFTNPDYSGVTSEEWKDVPLLNEYRYYLNDWNGERWTKCEIKEGESVVILDNDGIKMHEWRLIDGVLVDTLEILRGEVMAELTAIKDEVDVIARKLENEVAEREAADEELHRLIENEIEERQNAINAVKLAIEEERNERIEADERLNERIDEANERIDEVNNKVDEFIEKTENKFDEVDNRIDELNKELEDTNVRLGQEITERQEADKKLQENIDKNKVVLADEESGLVLVDGYVDEKGQVHNTTLKVKVPETGMIKVDAEGLYFDGNYNFGGDWIINNE